MRPVSTRGRPARFAAWAILALLTLPACGSPFFHPTREHLPAPPLAGILPEDVWFPSGDGLRLHGWFLAPAGPAKGTVLFLHGNAENVSAHIGAVSWLVREGYAVFAFDYRGYGKSDGRPDIPGVHKDALAALDLVFRIPRATPGRVAVFGQSLGGAIAVYTVANSPRKGEVRALIEEGAFLGYRRIVRDKLKEFVVTWPLAYPVSWFFDDTYSPERWIRKVGPIPVIVIHGTRDAVVPYDHGKRLYELANDPKGFWTIDGGGHVTALSNPEVRAQFLSFLASVLSPEENSPSIGREIVPK